MSLIKLLSGRGIWSLLVAFGFAVSNGTFADALYELEGEWIEGGMLIGKALPGTEIEFKGDPVLVAEDGLFVIGLHRNEESQVSLRATASDGNEQVNTYDVNQREYQVQRIEGISRKITEPTKEDQDRIWAEVQQTKKARAITSTRRDFLQEFRWPLVGIITGVYGSARYYNGKAGTPHYGIDIAAPKGTPVVAPASGIVTLTHNNMFYSGGTLMIDHGHSVSSTFIHLSKLLVEEGQEVVAGEVIAEVGSTGRSTGPHLDWRMNWGGARIDPQLLVPPMPKVESTTAAD